MRRGVRRWLATLASAPVLLDAYQLQIEQNIMSDTFSQALVVGALVLLAVDRGPAEFLREYQGVAYTRGPVLAAGLLLCIGER